MKKIAVVGTGIMGSGIATNYLKAGYEVAIWNRSADKTAELRTAGAKQVDSPKAATEQADIIFEVTANDASSQAVWEGKQGILAGANSSKTLIASSTLSIDWISSLIEQTKTYSFFDMPLTGGRVAAEGGTLTLLVGGNDAALEKLKPELAAISSKVLYFGPAGSGMKYKLVLNSLQAAHIAAFGEAMKLAQSQGLDPAKVGPALCERPGGALTNIAWQAYQESGPMPLTFSVDWITKDLGYARAMSHQAVLPILDDVLQVYQTTQAAGHGAEDWTAILKNQT